MQRTRRQRIGRALAKGLVYFLALVVVLIVAALLALETGWANERLRGLVVRQANQYLTANLEIGALGGSLLRGIQLDDVRLARPGGGLVSIERIELSYSIRELLGDGVLIRRLRVVRPRVLVERQEDGRWNLAALVRRDARQEQRRGPGRPIHIQQIEVIDGDVTVRDDLRLAFALAPRRYASLNALLTFDYEPVAWRLDFERASWSGGQTDLTMELLTGSISSGRGGMAFDRLAVRTPRSAFTVEGRVIRNQPDSDGSGTPRTALDLTVNAERFAFQEWSGLVGGLRNIAVDASFGVRLAGPVNRLATDLDLKSNGGNVAGSFTLDTTVPGSRGTGTVTVERVDLARWLNRPERPSNITGRVAFDLDLELGRSGGFPRGPYTFDGPHAEFMSYGADDVHARGTINRTDALVTEASGVAYGSNFRVTSGAIGLASPYPYTFQGSADSVDLRDVPSAVPVPHVASTLAFDFEISGRFVSPFIIGSARFADSEFLGATVASGTTGSVDSSTPPLRYSGEGDIAGVDLQRFARDLAIEWLKDPRYAGQISGHFTVNGIGTDAATLTLAGGGRLAQAALFGGTLSNAAVFIEVDRGSLNGRYDGRFDGIDAAIPFNDPLVTGSLNGSGTFAVSVPDLLADTPDITAYTVDSTFTLENSTLRDVPIDAASATASLAGGVLSIGRLDARGPTLAGNAAGTLELTGDRHTDVRYTVERADLSLFKDLLERDASGLLATTGSATGPRSGLRLSGEATVSQLSTAGLTAQTVRARYDATVPTADPVMMTANLSGAAELVEVGGRNLPQVEAVVTYDGGRIEGSLRTEPAGTRHALSGAMLLHRDRRSAEVLRLMMTVRGSDWQLVTATPPPQVTWDERGVALTTMEFADVATGTQRIALGGTVRRDGAGALEVTARRLSLDTLIAVSGGPATYGGFLDAEGTVRGTFERPLVSSTVLVTEGRVRRLSYERLAGTIDFSDDFLMVDLRLDQTPGVWLTAQGTVPMALFDRRRPEAPIDVAISSSPVDLGLLETVTDVVREVSGSLQLNVTAVGTSSDPHFTGFVGITDAAFLVAATGVRYRNGAAALLLAQDQIRVDGVHVEDEDGQSLDLVGSLGTHELQVGDLEVEMRSTGFEVLRNEYGTVNVDARLSMRGQFESPRITGTVTVTDGEVRADSILDRILLAPYSTEEAESAVNVDAIRALNPWERLGLDIEVRVPGTVEVTGDAVQLAAGTPVGLSAFDLRLIGDLYLYKDPAQPLYVTGSFDSVTGTVAFQGRRFDVDPGSSINFRYDLNPEVYVIVRRVISGVETTVTIAGPMREPELRLASTPPLEPSDVLSLIVFGTSANQLSEAQQEELAVRAGTLAAGFLASSLVSALERSLGLDILEIEAPGQPGAGPRVTVGDEIAPGLVARFSRQFGQEEYDEATIEYYLSRIFRIRATFSDAGALISRSPFRRVERAGIDLLLFFSF
jgi:autotransporter translocation and assembly factor TamB